MSVYKKLLAAFGEIQGVEKSGRNDFHRYNYQRATDVGKEVRSALFKHGLVPEISVIKREDSDVQSVNDKGQTKIMHCCHVELSTAFIDAETGEKTQAIHSHGTAMDSGDKAIYKAITGAVKYALRNAFLIPDEKTDPEADRHVDEETGGMIDPDSLEKSILGVQSMADVNAVLPQVQMANIHALKVLLKRKAEFLGLVYDNSAKGFVPDENAPAESSVGTSADDTKAGAYGNDLTPILKESLQSVQKRHDLKPASQVKPKPKSAPKGDSEPAMDTLTQLQIRKLWSLSDDCGFNEQQTRDLAGRFGHEGSFKHMDIKIYDALIAELELYVKKGEQEGLKA